MTLLEEIHQLASDAIRQSQSLTITTRKIGEKEHNFDPVKQALMLLQIADEIVFKPSKSTPDDSVPQLTLEGELSSPNHLKGAVKIILTDPAVNSRACAMQIDLFSSCTPKSLVERGLFTVPEGVKGAEFFSRSFTRVSIEAASDAGLAELKITGIEAETNNVELEVGVTKSVGGDDVDPSCSVRVEALQQPLAIEPDTVAGWVGVQNIFDQVPDEISPLKDFGLKELSFSLDIKTATVLTVQIVISTSKVWKLVPGVDLNRIAVVADISLADIASQVVSLRGEALLSLGTLNLDCSITFPIESPDFILTFATAAPFNLSGLTSLPGCDALNQLGFDQLRSDKNSIDQIEVELNDLIFIANLKSPQKLRSISLSVSTNNLNLDILPGLLSISNPQLHLGLSRGANAWQADARLSGQLGFNLLEKPEDMVFADFEVSRTEGRWNLSAELISEVPILEAARKLGVGDDFPGALKTLTLAGLSAQYAAGRNQPPEFSFNTVIELPETKLADLQFKNTALSISYHRAQNVSMSLRAATSLPDFNNAEIALIFAYDQGWSVMIEVLGIRLTYNTKAGTAQVNLGSKTVGEIIQTVYRLVKLDARAELPEPWNALEGISLRGARFTINFPTGSFSIAQTLDPEVDLGFFRLKEIGVSYANRRVNLMVKGRLLGAGADSEFNCDPTNPGANLPPQPSAAKLLELRLLALGQRLQLKPSREVPEIRRVSDAITLMGEAFKTSDPTGHPLATTGSTLAFDARNGLLVGADFTLLGALSMAIVFNDGVIAGVSVGLDRKRARFFRGLEFEVLYKKISESIGVYQINLQLPDAIRQIELGQVSITAPALWLEIYTNGNFRVDLGFPKNNDFSRSFQLQVFPFLGGGGFYFAKLEGATAQRLPKDRDNALPVETFKPVLAFGLGLRIGLGKSINRGILDVAMLSGRRFAGPARPVPCSRRRCAQPSWPTFVPSEGRQRSG